MRNLFTDYNNSWQVWAARLLIFIVLFFNLQAAFLFMLSPESFVPAFQLEGVPGRVAVVGTGILFLMWQVPYIFAVAHPVRFKVSLWQALIMQLIGVVGESLLLAQIPIEYAQLRNSILRFILFDAGGVVFLFIAVGLIHDLKFKESSG